jgi:hypothetical protein
MRDMRRDRAPGLVKFGAVEATTKWRCDGVQKLAA